MINIFNNSFTSSKSYSKVHLQSLLQTKDSNLIYDKISFWLKQLKNIDQITSILSDVQHTWSHLGQIFSENEDIREQFPKHAILFENIDSNFKVLFIHVVLFS
jgi:hypothetical protein